MSCGQSNFTPRQGSTDSTSVLPLSVLSSSGPFLVVSNNPEYVGNVSSSHTLYKYEIPLTSGTQRIRLFLWHVNSLISGGTCYFNVVASLDQGTGTVVDPVIEEPTPTGDYVSMGVCCAKAHYFGSWNSPGDDISIGTSETSLWATSRSINALAGMVMEFDVALENSATLRLRTTASTSSGIPGSWSDSPLAAVGSKPRGWWPFSHLDLDGGEFNAKPSSPNTQHTATVSVCDADGPEIGANGFISLRAGDIANKGCYGANLSYKIKLFNDGNQIYPVYCYENIRGTGQPAGGVTGIVDPSGFLIRGVNNLLASANRHLVRLTVNSSENETPISVPANTTNLPLQIDVAVAGSTATPFNLNLTGISISPDT